MLEIRALGGFEITDPPILQGLGLKPRLLLVVLASSSEVMPRRRIAELLWPGHSTSSALHSLSQALYVLRKGGMAPFLEANDSAISLSRSTSIDTALFDQALQKGQLTLAARTYGGVFAHGVQAPSDTFEDWLAIVRLGFHQRARKLAFMVRDALAARECLQLTEKLLQFDPLDADVRSMRINLFAALGQIPAATKLFIESRKLWPAELGEPWPYAEPRTAVQFSAEGRPRSKVFVGRQLEMDRLSRAWAALNQSGFRQIVITGEPGVGKTALAQRFRRLLALRGHGAAWAAASPAEKATPLGIVEQWISDLRPAEGNERLGTASVHLSWNSPGIPPEYESAADGRHRVFAALVDRLVQREKTPVLFIDDLQWADEATLGLLAFVGRRAPEAPLMVVATNRASELGVDRLPTEFRDFDSIKIGPLSADEVVEFCRRATDPATSATKIESAAAALYGRTGGNPLFLTALLAEGLYESAESQRIPQSLVQYLEPRLEGLSSTCRITLAALGIAGGVSMNTLRDIVDIEQGDLEAVIAELSRVEFVEFAKDVLSVRHGVMAEVALRMVGPAVERQLRGRAARALQRETGTSAATVAFHFDLAGQKEKAFEAAVRAASAATELFAHHEAEYFLKIALTNAPNPQGAVDIRCRLADIYLSQSRYELAASILEEPQDTVLSALVAAKLAAHRAVIRLLSLRDPAALGEFRQLLDQIGPALEPYLRARLAMAYASAAHSFGYEAAVDESLDMVSKLSAAVPDEQLGLRIRMRLAFLIAIYRSATEALTELNALSDIAHKWPDTLALWYATRGSASIAAGFSDGAERDLLRSLELVESTGGSDAAYMVLNNLGVLYQEQGRFDEAQVMLQKALGRDAEAEVAPWAQVALDNLAILAYERGNYEYSIHLANRGLRISNHNPKSLRSWFSQTSIKGLCFLELGDRQRAHDCRRDIQVASRRQDYTSNDVSYVEIFIGRMYALSGRQEEAVVRLGRTADRNWARNFFCAARISLERYRFLLLADPALVIAEAATLRPRLVEAKAHPLIERLDRLVARAGNTTAS